MLAQMLRAPAILELATRRIEAHHIKDPKVGGTPSQAVFFSIIKNYYLEHKDTPDLATVRAELEKFINDHFGFSKQQADKVSADFAALSGWCAQIDDRSEKLARRVVRFITERCVIVPAAKELLQTALDSASRSDEFLGSIGEKLQKLENEQKSLAGGLSISNISTFSDADGGERVLTGVPWLDARFGDGAGPVRGCTVGIIGPQGGGKTTMGINLAVSQALNCQHSLLVLAEEGISKSMRRKITP
jgi:RecA/RadA recombinase